MVFPPAPLERLERIDEGSHGEIVLTMKALHVVVRGAFGADGEVRSAGVLGGDGPDPSHGGGFRSDGGEVGGVHRHCFELLERESSSRCSINSRGR